MTNPLDKLERVLQASEPGPWFTQDDTAPLSFMGTVHSKERVVATPNHHFNPEADNACIVALRNLAPHLLKVCRAARKVDYHVEHHWRCMVYDKDLGPCTCGVNDLSEVLTALEAAIGEEIP